MRRVSKKTGQSGEGTAPSGPTLRRSPRFNEKAKPSAAIIAAKKNARLRLANKKTLDVAIRDIYQTARDSRELVRKDTGIVYDKRMVAHHCLWDANYPECPERYSRVLERCESLGLISRCLTILPREATESEILAKHTPEQIEILKATENVTDEDFLEKLSSKYDAIYIHPNSYRLSLLATGCTIELVDAVCTKKIQNGMAIVRPPGHHAMKSEYCGYCFFNNVALAVNHALEQCGLSRILIVDWDVHHGQATQQMFYDDPRVVYFSIHRYEYGTFWPNLQESDFHFVGEGKGKGYNFNIPLNKIGMADSDYLAIFHQILLPIAGEFQPELVLVSAGYDAAIGCPEGEMEVTPNCYAHLLSSLLGLASGKVAVILEGGYCLKSLAEGAALTLRCLLGDPCPVLPKLNAPSDCIRNTILDVIYSHRDYWQCFQFQDTYRVGLEPHGPILSTIKGSGSTICGSNSKQKWTEAGDMISEEVHKSGSQQDKMMRHFPVVKFLGSEDRPESYNTRNCYPVQNVQVLKDIDARLNNLITNTKLSFAPHKVCFVYDERMLKHKNIADPSHPEKPERISTIYFRHEEYGLLERCHHLKARSVSQEELLLLHTKDHIDQMHATKNMKLRELNKLQDDFKSLYLHPESYDSACIAAGSLLQVVDSVLNGESQSGVAVVRPPGHHAEEEEPCGFCLFNSVSLAAKYAVEVHRLKRVLLLDWDVHHGNGSQHMFESDPRVLYLSLHRYDNGSFFPGSTDANYTVVGSGAGIGYNINIPWNKRGMSDADYIAAFHQVVMPICYQFAPELVLVSAGFDAAVGDPLGGCKVSPEAYSHMTHWLSSLANGRIILSLEGGYNVTSISYAMTLCTKALLGDPLPPLQPRISACPSAVTSIKNVIRVHSKYWSCLKFNVALPQQNVLPKNEKKINIVDKNANEKVTGKVAMELINIHFPKQQSSKLKMDVTKIVSSIVADTTDTGVIQSNVDQSNNIISNTVSITTDMIPNESLAKLNLKEVIIPDVTIVTSPIKSEEKINFSSESCKEYRKSLESPLSEDSANFVVSPTASSLEGDSQVWSQMSSTSISESLEEEMMDSMSPIDHSNNTNNSVNSVEANIAINNEIAHYAYSEQINNIPQLISNIAIFNKSSEVFPENILISGEVKKDSNSNTQSPIPRPLTLQLQCSTSSQNFTDECNKIVEGTSKGARTVSDHNSNSSSSEDGSQPSASGSNVSQSVEASGSAEKPQTLVDYLSDNMQLLLAEQMFAVVPLPNCPHLIAVRDVPACGLDCTTPCMECGSTLENWVCLICYSVHCGRYINEHMMHHGTDTSHPLTLSFSDLSVWCYACEAYIDNQVLYNAKNAVHRSKFGDDLPWSYGD